MLLVLRHGPALYAAFLGCMMAGCVPAFLAFPTPKQDPVLYWQALAALLRRIGAAGLITYPENAAPLRAALAGAAAQVPDAQVADVRVAAARVWILGEEAAAPPLATWRDGAGTDIALLQHSSGTTGLRKGVALSHAAGWLAPARRLCREPSASRAGV